MWYSKIFLVDLLIIIVRVKTTTIRVGSFFPEPIEEAYLMNPFVNKIVNYGLPSNIEKNMEREI